ncbi:hypothetical protein [Virgibacillus kimchii]
MKNQKMRSRSMKIAIFLLILLLFQTFIWNEYVINTTAESALEGEEGERGILTEIDRERSFGIVKLEDGFRAYTLSEGFLGWSITDNEFISTETSDIIFNVKKETLLSKGDKEIYVILIATDHEDVTNIIAYDDKNEEIGLWKQPHDGTKLYFAFSESPYPEGITYEAYSQEQLLYKITD